MVGEQIEASNRLGRRRPCSYSSRGRSVGGTMSRQWIVYASSGNVVQWRSNTASKFYFSPKMVPYNVVHRDTRRLYKSYSNKYLAFLITQICFWGGNAERKELKLKYVLMFKTNTVVTFLWPKLSGNLDTPLWSHLAIVEFTVAAHLHVTLQEPTLFSFQSKLANRLFSDEIESRSHYSNSRNQNGLIFSMPLESSNPGYLLRKSPWENGSYRPYSWFSRTEIAE